MAAPVIAHGVIRRTSPLDGRPLPEVRADSPAYVQAAVARARTAQRVWGGYSVGERVKLLGHVRRRFLQASDAIVAALAQENGKPAAEALLAEVLPNVDLFDYWMRKAPELLEPEPVSLSPVNFPGKKGVIVYRPRGVIGLISPWNFPVALPLRTLVPALLGGNTVVFKPSEHSPETGALVAGLFQAELPPGTVELVQGAGEVGSALCDAGVDMVVFTGSVATGRKVAVRTAERLIPCALELGGKDPAIVLEDADLERSAQGIAWAGFANAGQNCAAVERVYVVDKVADRFVARLAEIARSLRLGTEVGPLTTEAQLEEVLRQLAEARSRGARIAAGGQLRPPGRFLEPTVLVDVTDDMAVMCEETFGPVLPVAVVKDEAEAIERANRSRFGLTASVWTRDLRRGRRVAEKLRVGVLTINNHAFTGALPMAPWTGVGESGFGVTNSPHAFREMCRPSFVLVDGLTRPREMWWYPYTPALEEIGRSMVGLLRAGLAEKPGQVLRLLKSFSRRFKNAAPTGPAATSTSPVQASAAASTSPVQASAAASTSPVQASAAPTGLNGGPRPGGIE